MPASHAGTLTRGDCCRIQRADHVLQDGVAMSVRRIAVDVAAFLIVTLTTRRRH
jgi:hypothetical protein